MISLTANVVMADGTTVSTSTSEQKNPELKTIEVQIPANTQFTIKPVDKIVASKVKVGDFVNFQVSTDVSVNQQVVIKAGASAIGQITVAQPPKMQSVSAALEIKILNVTCVDNQTVPVIGSFSEVSKVGGAAYIPFVGLKHGKDVIVPVTYEIKVLIPNAVTVKIAQ